MERDDEFYSRYKDGSTELGGDSDAIHLNQGSGPIARDGNAIIRFQPTQPSVLFGGAGSGKFGNVGAYQLVHPAMFGRSFFILDVGGQYMNTTWHWNLAAGRKAYAANLQGIGLYSDINHPVDLFAILKDDHAF